MPRSGELDASSIRMKMATLFALRAARHWAA
jgi:hypothetical protein